MKLIDLNLLLYAVNRDSARHKRAKLWLEATLSGEETVALPWVVLLGFLRIATSPRILTRRLRAEQAMSVVDGWLRLPSVVALDAGPEHWRILRGLLAESGTAGNLTTDAHLAALAIENGCELCSTDGDFSRFRHLRWVNPLAE
ncbi:MAG: type II toxin-antitoxin system VapC family toxin [Gemmatimonadetes bacterium]|nr:type II toxin-antitoxin system VapC family toxin [Gemmatimonadota bacterium]